MYFQRQKKKNIYIYIYRGYVVHSTPVICTGMFLFIAPFIMVQLVYIICVMLTLTGQWTVWLCDCQFVVAFVVNIAVEVV